MIVFCVIKLAVIRFDVVHKVFEDEYLSGLALLSIAHLEPTRKIRNEKKKNVPESSGVICIGRQTKVEISTFGRFLTP